MFDDSPKVGSLAPIFVLPDQNGAELSLNDLVGSKVVMIFYRGEW